MARLVGKPEPSLLQLVDAADYADWTQVALNHAYGKPCFHFERDRKRFCLRASAWDGHNYPDSDFGHKYVSLGDLLRKVAQ